MTPLKGIRVLFTKKTNADTSTLNDLSDALTAELGNTTPGTDEYEKLLAQLERVRKMIEKDPNPPWTFKPSADVIVTGVITVFCTLFIIKHEAVNVITSKALSFLPKLMK
jgi:hypothetical protein